MKGKERGLMQHFLAHEIKRNTPKFFHIDIVIILDVRYVCFDFMSQKMAINPLSLPFLVVIIKVSYNNYSKAGVSP